MNKNTLRLIALLGLAAVAVAAVGLEQPWKARLGYSGLLVAMIAAGLRVVPAWGEVGRRIKKASSDREPKH